MKSLTLGQEDRIVINQLKQGDEHALSVLYDKYSGAIYSVILKMIKDEDKAQDLLQETFITVWKKANQYDVSKGRFYTWVYRIAKNKVLNVLRKSEPLIQTEDLSVYEGKENNISIDPKYLELNGALTKLEAHHKMAIELVYFRGFTHQEAHEEMGVPLGTFKSYVRQALRNLRETYDKILGLIIVILIGL